MIRFGAAVLLSFCGAADTVRGADAPPYLGFTPFPYDFTLEAIDRVNGLIAEHATLYALHFDDGVPWSEALSGEAFPAEIRRDWDDWAGRIPKGHAVYLGLNPLGKDRSSLAAAKSGRMPGALRGAALDKPELQQAYLTYAQRAVRQFRPQYLNLGIETGELAARDPERWTQLVALYDHVRDALKREFPSLQIGLSFGLQSLLDPKVAELVKPVVERSDYFGLSFYPYGSSFGEKFGAPPLPQGAAAWQDPLAWARRYTTKPIAICETGFTTKDIRLPKYDLEMHGDDATQAAYVRDLLETARRDRYAFVVWFLVIDYDALYAKMPKGSEENLLWRNVGLWSGDLKPKPAWELWTAAVARDRPAGRVDTAGGDRPAVTTSSAPASLPPAGGDAASSPVGGLRFGFDRAADLFTAPPPEVVTLAPGEGPRPDTPAMRWDYRYRGEWEWCVRDIPVGSTGTAKRMSFAVRSDRAGPIFVQLEEDHGETFFAIVPVETGWKSTALDLDTLTVDPSKKKDGRLEPNRVKRVLIADSAAGDGATGRRSLWFADWLFLR